MWSVGAILCELITGQPLFKVDRNLLKQHIEYCGPVDERVLRMVNKHFSFLIFIIIKSNCSPIIIFQIASQGDKEAIEAYSNRSERQVFATTFDLHITRKTFRTLSKFCWRRCCPDAESVRQIWSTARSNCAISSIALSSSIPIAGLFNRERYTWKCSVPIAIFDKEFFVVKGES